MGYSDFANFKLLDGYSVTTTASAPINTNYVDVHSANNFNITCVFTGGAPAGTLKLRMSNDLQWTGGNRPQPLHTGGEGHVDDTIDVPTGNGQASVSVSGAGVYELDQHFFGARWFQVVFTPSNNVTTQMDIFVNWKHS
jgi:hypothetical protein